MNTTSDFDTLYDLPSLGWQHGPLLAIGVLVLAVALAALWRQRRRGGAQALPGFFVAVGVVMQVVAGLAWWETQLLVSSLNGGQAQVAQGLVQSHEVRQRAFWNGNSKRYDRSTWETFLVGEMAFGFTRDGSAVGFTNGGSTPLALADGDVLRVHFVEQTPGDFASRRILKLERLRTGRGATVAQQGG
jgi:hypothetical protein